MKKSSLSLIVAAGLMAAGLAQAQTTDTFDSPLRAGEMSTMTQGEPNAATNNVGIPAPDWTPGSHTMVLGAGPATVTTDTYVTTYSYALPPHYVLPAPVVIHEHEGADETSNVPLRAGEMSTMTHGEPNALTNNW